MDTVELVAAVGTPEIAPVELFRDRPAGNAPEATEKVRGAFPPVAWTVKE
jgi:hypothetical protein